MESNTFLLFETREETAGALTVLHVNNDMICTSNFIICGFVEVHEGLKEKKSYQKVKQFEVNN